MQYVEKLRATVESLLFITNEPLSPAQIAELAEIEEDDVLDVLDWLQEDYSDASKGIGVMKLGDGYIMAIKQDYLPYVEMIRGVKADKIVQNLIAKELIEEQGRKDAPGRPILYGTTRKFLQYFNIESLDQLPSNHLLNLDPAEAESLVADELELLEIER